MACPNIANDEITMLKTARERMGAGYNSNYTITSPIYMSDLQRLSGGNTSGSGNSYPAVSLANPVTNRPDGENPLQFSEFSQYDQNPARTAFQYNYSSSSSSGACETAIPTGPYYHTDGNNLVPSAANTYYAYTTASGTTPVSAGYYSIYSTGNIGVPTGDYIQVGSNGLITAIGSC